MAVTLRNVRLPDGKEALEAERQHIGGSETQLTYTYSHEWGGPEISKQSYETDYWGRIKGIIILDD